MQKFLFAFESNLIGGLILKPVRNIYRMVSEWISVSQATPHSKPGRIWKIIYIHKFISLN